ncbi:MAG: NAD(P)/FAD-dependent oxidoreductase [Cyclobacteriaceae bacterium]
MVDVAIIGGGLAGLINAILLARGGLSVLLVEKKSYPFHRVCGEYISNEVVPFLSRNRLFPAHIDVSDIKKFLLTSTSGKQAHLDLDLGGFGISRYEFDHFLYQKALEAGVECMTNTTVEDVKFTDNHFVINTGASEVFSKLVIGAHGKRSRIDKKLNRGFIHSKSPYLAVKYHIKTDFPHDTIALHNFDGGYCGISKVENETYNLCYLSHRRNMKKHKAIGEMEETILFKNPFLKNIFEHSDFVFERPLVINEISFENKLPVENHMLMCGDAAGMVTPLCGNGMAMAIHSASILSQIILQHKKMDGFVLEKIESTYQKSWEHYFSFRMWAGRRIQTLFGSVPASGLAVAMANLKPIGRSLVSLTHGKEF